MSRLSAEPLSRKDHYDYIHPQGHDGEVIVWQSRLNKGAWRKVLNADDMCRFLRTENDRKMHSMQDGCLRLLR